MFMIDILILTPLDNTYMFLRDLFGHEYCTPAPMENDVAQVTNNLYITSFRGAFTERINSSKFDAIIDMCDCTWPGDAEYHLPVYKYAIADEYLQPQDIGKTLAIVLAAAAKINELIHQNKHVLVNCAAGINRSALAIGIYLIKYANCTPPQALLMIKNANKTRNKQYLTNPSFRAILLNSSLFL